MRATCGSPTPAHAPCWKSRRASSKRPSFASISAHACQLAQWRASIATARRNISRALAVSLPARKSSTPHAWSSAASRRPGRKPRLKSASALSRLPRRASISAYACRLYVDDGFSRSARSKSAAASSKRSSRASITAHAWNVAALRPFAASARRKSRRASSLSPSFASITAHACHT